MHLFRCYHIEKEIIKFEDKRNEAEASLKTAEALQKSTKEIQEQRKLAQANLLNELSELDENIQILVSASSLYRRTSLNATSVIII